MKSRDVEADVTGGTKHLGRARRAIAACAKAAGLAAVFGAAVVGGVLIHAGLRAPKSFALEQVNGILEGSFQGKVELRKIDVLRLNRFEGVDADVFDPEGNHVLGVRGVNVKVDTFTVVRTLFTGDRTKIGISKVEVGSAEVVIDENEQGELGIQRAFASRTPPSGEPSRPTEVEVSDIYVEHVWIHGGLAASPVIDLDLEGFKGRFASKPEHTEIRVDQLWIEGRAVAGVAPRGSLRAHTFIPEDPAALAVAAQFDGSVGDVTVFADARMEDGLVDAIVDVPETDSFALNAFAPEQLALTDSASLHAEVHGQMPVLHADIEAYAGDGSVFATAAMTLPDDTTADTAVDASLEVADLDLRAVLATAPPSNLNASLEASVIVSEGGELSGEYALVNQRGELDENLIPAAAIVGNFTQSRVRGAGHIAEPGAPIDIAFSLLPRPGATEPTIARFDVSGAVDVGRLERLGPVGRGTATVVASGSYDLGSQWVDADARVVAARVVSGGTAVDRADVRVQVTGPADDFTLDANVRGAGLRTAGYGFVSFDASADGTLRGLDVKANLTGDKNTPTVRAAARVAQGDGTVVSGAQVLASRAGVEAVARVATVRIGNGDVAVRGLVVSGLGQPVRADLSLGRGGAMVVKAIGADIDLARVGRLIGKEQQGVRGHVALDIDARASAGGNRGRVNVGAVGVSFGEVRGGDAKVQLDLEGRRVRGEVAVELGKAGAVTLELEDVMLAGSLIEPTSWKRATGTVGIDGAIDASQMLARLPADSVPVAAASGTITVKGKVSRTSSRGLPGADLEIATERFTVTAREVLDAELDGVAVASKPPFRLAGIDGVVRLTLDDKSGDLAVGARLKDARGELASFEVKGRPPIERILDGTADLSRVVATLPIEAHVEVPRRSFDDLPEELPKLPIEGEFELVADVRGTLRAPNLSLTAKGHGLMPRGSANCTRTVDVETTATYDGKTGDVDIKAQSGGREVLAANATIAFDASQIASGKKGAPAWNASADLEIKDLPLELASAVINQPLVGTLDGKATIKDLHRAASMEARFDLRDVKIDKSEIQKGFVTVAMRDNQFTAEVSLDQSDGHFDAKVVAAMAWGDQIAPKIDTKRPIDIALNAKNFRADIAKPFAGEALSEIDGRIDTTAKIRVAAGGKDGTVDGEIALRDGVFEIPAVGERFHGVNGKIVMEPWGTLKLQDFEAQGPTGRLTASAEAVLDGVTLKTAKATVKIPKGESLPISVEGVPMGRAYGDIAIAANMTNDGKRLDVKVDVPVLEVALPRSSGNSVQALEPDPNVKVGYVDGGKFMGLVLAKPQKVHKSSSDMVVNADIKLGEEVVIKRDAMLDVALTGGVSVEVRDKARITGEIKLLRGKLELQGKLFTIERGIVSFTGNDPPSPLIQATAYWDAPDGTRVFADFTGYAEKGTLSLRSEPALTQDEILALILFGSPDGGFGTSNAETSTGVQAVGIAGGAVTEGLNKALSGVTTRVSTRIDSSDASGPQPQIVVQLTDKVSARLGYKLGNPGPGDDPDRAQLTVDWRFFKNWNVGATIGDHGSTSVDLVWRLHY